jgi:hypothetical protein
MGCVRKHEPIYYFERHISPEPNSGCWLWTAYLHKGYGQFSVRRKIIGAHVFSYRHYRGMIPAGMTVDHKCRVRCCVNPDHLRLLTRAENVLIGEGRAAKNARKTHCHRGHPLAEDNIYIGRSKNGKPTRTCKICRATWNNENPQPVTERRRIQRVEAQRRYRERQSNA